jgi:hypothetical protein
MAPIWESAAILGVPLLLLGFWARWLGRRPSAPRFIRALPVALFLACTAALAAQYFTLAKAVDGLSGDDIDPTTKSKFLAESIVVASRFWLAGAAALVVALLYLLFATWRYHWSVRPPVVPSSPPYR